MARTVKVAFVAPGQGIEDWSAGLRLLDESPETQRIYEQVDDATGVDILLHCQDPEPSRSPEVVQPAAVGIGYAQANVLAERGIKPDYLIGISAGEFTTAAIANSMTLAKAAYYSQQRGIYQTEAAGGLGSAVTALHRRPLDLKTILHELEGAWPANYHAPGVTTFGYLNDSYSQLVKRLEAQGARLRELNMPFPPHGHPVKAAEDRLGTLLRKRGAVKKPDVKMISIRTAKVVQKAQSFRNNLIWQTTEPTQLNRAVNRALAEGVEEFYDLGPGDMVAKLLGRIITDPVVRIHPV